jgi:hypothetical protein
MTSPNPARPRWPLGAEWWQSNGDHARRREEEEGNQGTDVDYALRLRGVVGWRLMARRVDPVGGRECRGTLAGDGSRGACVMRAVDGS